MLEYMARLQKSMENSTNPEYNNLQEEKLSNIPFYLLLDG